MTGCKILMIDDDVEYLQEMKEVLEGAGYDVSTLSNSIVAVEVAKQKQPDVILLDLKMDGMSGQQVAQVLKQDQATRFIKLVILSGHVNHEDVVRLKEAWGAEEILQKPIEPTHLVALLESLTGRST